MSINIVRQEDDLGCAVACIATILGKTYREVAKDFLHDFSEEPLHTDTLLNYLSLHDCCFIRKELKHWNNVEFGREEMLKPFAPIHIVMLEYYFDAKFAHLVIMDDKGNFYDPESLSEEIDKEVRESFAVTSVIGVYRPIDFKEKPVKIKK